MLKVVRNIIQALEVPGAQVELRRGERDQWLDVPLTASKGVQTPNGTKVVLHDEDSVIWRLLAEHLGDLAFSTQVLYAEILQSRQITDLL